MRSEDSEARAAKVTARDMQQREKLASKDGTVQRTAKEVEGLKDFVCTTRPSSLGKDAVVFHVADMRMRKSSIVL